jgi:hypothetical protein
MRFIRSAATTLTLAGAATLAASAVPAFNVPAFAQGPTVDVSPSTVLPGASVTFSIICDTPSATSATLIGTTLGLPSKVPMNPTSQPGEFTVTVNLPTSISPGTYTPPLTCNDRTMRTATLTVTPASPPVISVTPSVATPGAAVTFSVTCGPGATSASLFGATLGLADQIPMGVAANPGEFTTTVNLPASISPGTYSPSIDCNPSGQSGSAFLTVNPLIPPPPVRPPLTGDGATATVMGGPFSMAGLALLGAGGLAVGAGVLRKRRRAGAGSVFPPEG